jgi:hypothetical protein
VAVYLSTQIKYIKMCIFINLSMEKKIYMIPLHIRFVAHERGQYDLDDCEF